MELGLTQEKLAGQCADRGWDLSRAGLSKIEAGIRRVNDAELLLLSDIVQMPIHDFYGLPEKATKNQVKTAADGALSVARHGRD